MKTDLAKILTVSGQRGLFQYIAQARHGIIAESLSDKKRVVFDAKSRITTLADIAIYTQREELKLQEVFFVLVSVVMYVYPSITNICNMISIISINTYSLVFLLSGNLDFVFQSL